VAKANSDFESVTTVGRITALPFTEKTSLKAACVRAAVLVNGAGFVKLAPHFDHTILPR
jgi:hypothetical protein